MQARQVDDRLNLLPVPTGQYERCSLPITIEYSDSLLDAIYDTATEPELWPSVLTQIADLTGSQGGILFGQSFGARRVYFDYNGRLSGECNQAYKERHVQNPWNDAMQRQPVGRVVLSDEVVSLASLQPTLFYDEVLRPQDVAHNVMIALAARDDFCVAFNLCRSTRQGQVSAEQQESMGKLVPHLRRAIGLAYRIEGYRALRAGQYHVLDRLAVGVVLLDRRSRVLYASAAARAYDTADGPLSLRRNSITARSPSHAQRLAALISAALLGAPSASMSIPRSDDGRLLTILVISARGKDVGRLGDLHLPDAAVMLFIVDPANRFGIPPAWLMDAYGLTHGETRVALAVSSGLSIPETAQQLRLSPNTIKTHLRRVFAKTGTNRQAELAQLMTSIGLISGLGGADNAS